jgi:hypothetical protein
MVLSMALFGYSVLLMNRSKKKNTIKALSMGLMQALKLKQKIFKQNIQDLQHISKQDKNIAQPNIRIYRIALNKSKMIQIKKTLLQVL